MSGVILGLSAYYHDSAAALLRDGELIAAAQEERFTRIKHDAAFPSHAIRYCLAEAGLTMADVDSVIFYEKPFLKFERLLETYLSFAPRGFRSFRMAMPVWLKEKLFQKKLLEDELKAFLPQGAASPRLLFSEHHQSHAASAYYPSPFDEALVLTMDGVGEWATTSVHIGRGAKLEAVREIRFPHSLGLLYSAFTYYTGFKVNSGEYKVMGLAPYGTPRSKDLILEKIVDLRDDGSFCLDQSYFDYCTGLVMTSRRFHDLFGLPPRLPEEELTQVHMDLAASIQAVTEEVMLRLTRALAEEFGIRNLCLAGGVALNCVANGKILRAGHFDAVWVQPAAGDAGGAVGAAYVAHFEGGTQPRVACRPMSDARTGRHHVDSHGSDGHDADGMSGSYLGPAYTQSDINARLERLGARFDVLGDDDVLVDTAEALANGEAVGWFQGRMEFGPRALGNRSILGDPRSPSMQKVLNLKVKYRESFRPFAPSVLSEDVADWFEYDGASPYMLIVDRVKDSRSRPMTEDEAARFGIDKLNVVRSEIPAVTHVDYSARIQTVHRETNPRYHALISAFKARTGCPMLVNTSFNVRGEPIVCTPEDAFRCFMGTGIDRLVIGNAVLLKSAQNPALKEDYSQAFALD